MQQLLFAGLGGFLGSALRYWISTATYRWLGESFPYGTLAVNIIGCLLIGFLMTFFEERFVINPNLRIFLTVGILGGFTTFSSFSYETMALLQEGSYWLGSVNVIASLTICLCATALGAALGRLL